MGYLLYKDFNDINDYCKSRCKKIINEHNKSTLNYARGQYKGYMYGISITSYLNKNKNRITNIKLYKIIKDEKNNVQHQYIQDRDYQKGIIDSLYDLMNFVSSID